MIYWLQYQKHQWWVPWSLGRGSREEVQCFGLLGVTCSILQRHWLFCASSPCLLGALGCRLDSSCSWIFPLLCRRTVLAVVLGNPVPSFVESSMSWKVQTRQKPLANWEHPHLGFDEGSFLAISHPWLYWYGPGNELAVPPGPRAVDRAHRAAEQLSSSFCVDPRTAGVKLSHWGLDGVAGDIRSH